LAITGPNRLKQTATLLKSKRPIKDFT